jgi:hypothetical protein
MIKICIIFAFILAIAVGGTITCLLNKHLSVFPTLLLGQPLA